MTTAIRDYLESLTYHVAPEDQGQIIEYAYALDWENGRVIERVRDLSVAKTRYYAIPAENLIGEFEPWNRAPEFTPDTEWQSITITGE